ncbi:unnamed protein product [Leuciscus chuanchicus]
MSRILENDSHNDSVAHCPLPALSSNRTKACVSFLSQGGDYDFPQLPCIQSHHHGGEPQAHVNTLAQSACSQSLKRPREQSHPEVRHAKNPHCSSYLTPIYINTPQSPPPSTAWQPAPMATTPTRVVWGFEEAGRVCIQSLKARITDGHRVSSFSGPQQIICRGMLCGLCQHVRLSNTSVCQEQWLDYKETQPGLPATNTIAVNC